VTRLEDALLMCFDLETTGVNPQEDRVVQLGVSYFRGGRHLQKHQQLIHPGVPIPPGAAAVHGVTDEHVREAPRLAQLLERLEAHFSGAVFAGPPPVLVGYNLISYDLPLFEAELRRAGAAWSVLQRPAIDVFTFVKWHLRHEPSRKLSDIAARFQIPLRAHDALSDAHATGLLLGRLFRDGYLPPTVEEITREEARLRPLLDEEYREYGNWLYHDRMTGELLLGTKRHTGLRLADVDAGFFRFILDKNKPEARAAEGGGERGDKGPPLPPRVRELFEARLR